MNFLKRKDTDMTSGPIIRQLIAFALPMTIGLLFQQLYSTVDSIVVGKFVGKTALAAVNATGPIVNMLISLCSAISVGSSVVISQCWGAHDKNEVGKAVHSTIALTLVVAAIATALGLILTVPMLHLMDAPEDVFDEAKCYLLIYFSGFSGLFLYNMGSAVLRAVGDSTRPLLFLILSALVNTALDVLLVAVFRTGVTGVAVATVFSQFLSAGLILRTLCREPGAYGLRWKQLKMDREMLGRIFRIGIPSGAESIITAFSNVFVQGYINFFGSDVMAAWGCYNRADRFLALPMSAFGMAITTFVGQNIGAKNITRARKGTFAVVGVSMGVTTVLTIIMILLRNQVMNLFCKASDTEVIRFGAMYLLYISPFYIINCVHQPIGGALRGANRPMLATITFMINLVGVRQLFLFLVTNCFEGRFHTPLGVGMAYPVGWTFAAISTLAVFLIARPMGILGKKSKRMEEC